MPGYNQMGPNGNGPATGGGRGRCMTNPQDPQTTPQDGAGFGSGRRRGRGKGNRQPGAGQGGNNQQGHGAGACRRNGGKGRGRDFGGANADDQTNQGGSTS
jgi:hypothetical protein